MTEHCETLSDIPGTARILRPPVCSLIGSVWLASMKDKCSSEKKNLHINFSLFVECVSPAESSLVFYSWSITSSSSESGQLSVSWGHLPPLRILENTYFGKFTIDYLWILVNCMIFHFSIIIEYLYQFWILDYIWIL